MNQKKTQLIMDNKIFLWLGLGTVLILLIPFIAMQFTNEVNWSVFDFAIMGILLFTTGSLFVFGARKVQKTEHRLLLAIGLGLLFLYTWAELAVGVFTNLGS